jgi:hypothetical protein
MKTLNHLLGMLMLSILFYSCDKNEHAPVIVDQNFTLSEDTPEEESFGTIVASDADAGQRLSYEITDGNLENIFRIDGSSGSLFVDDTDKLDYESSTHHVLQVVVSDNHKKDPLESSARIFLDVTDANEFAPQIPPSLEDEIFEILENSSAGTIIGLVQATDADRDQEVSYSISDGNDPGIFAIDPETGLISVMDATYLDFESDTTHWIVVTVADNHEDDPLESSAEIQINLMDENEFAPTMDDQSFTLDENPVNGQLIGKVLASDEDIYQNLLFSIADPKDEEFVTIHPQTGVLSVHDSTAFDYERNQTMSVGIRVQDDHAESMDVTAKVDITLLNVAELADGLVACYLFDGHAMNMVEDDNHGIESNVQYVSDRSGNPANSIYFNGSTSYVTIPHADELSFNAMNQSYSIAMWFKSPDPTHGTGNSARLIYKWDAKLATPYPYIFFGTTEALTTPIFGSTEQNLTCRLEGVWDDQWHHVLMVYDHTQHKMTAYLDGQFAESNSHQFSQSTYNDKAIFIGGVPAANRYFSGSIDDVYIFNRALSSEEAAALYLK